MVELFFVVLFVLVAAATIERGARDGIGSFLLLSASVKLSLCIAALFVALPFSGEDAVTFEEVAGQWSRMNFYQIVDTFDVGRSYVYTSIIALLYWLLERNIAIPVFINGILGVVTAYLGHVLVKRIWVGAQPPRLFYWVLCLHPMLAVFSAITLRENFIIFFAVLAAIAWSGFARSPSIGGALYTLIGVLLASFFHGGMVFLIAGVPVFLIFAKEFGVVARSVIGGVIVVALVAFLGSVDLAKVSVLQGDQFDEELLVSMDEGRREADSAYLTELRISSPFDLVWQLPIRMVYFAGTPFPWQIGSIGHFVVGLDAALWWFLGFLIIANIKTIWKNPAGRLMLLSLCCAIAVFAFGTGNFGTAFRHRTKFLILVLTLVAPFLPISRREKRSRERSRGYR